MLMTISTILSVVKYVSRWHKVNLIDGYVADYSSNLNDRNEKIKSVHSHFKRFIALRWKSVWMVNRPKGTTENASSLTTVLKMILIHADLMEPLKYFD